MSRAATKWAWAQSGLRPASKLVLLALADLCDAENRCEAPSPVLVDMTGLDRKTVFAAIDALDVFGRIAVSKGKGRPTTYQLSMEVVPKTALLGSTENGTTTSTRNGTATSARNGTSPENGAGVVPKTGLVIDIRPNPCALPTRADSSKNLAREFFTPEQAQTKHTGSSKKSVLSESRRKPISEHPDFLRLREIYPDRAGDQGWRRAFQACNARIAEGHTWQDILDGAERYARFIEATGRIGTEYVKQAATFCGPDKPFLNPWIPPPSKAEVRTATNLAGITEWLNS